MAKNESNQRIELNISQPAAEFKNHLELLNNKRIVFSGPYGSGKTYFLNKYFSEIDKNPNVIQLSPVHYSVASNEDIFELLKHDILFELFKKDIEFENVDFSRLLTYQTYIQENKINVLIPFIKSIPKIGKSLAEIIQVLKDFEKYNEEAQIDEEKEIIEFLNKFHEKLGTIHEENYYTQLITSLVDKLREKNEGKETILILDDLDRLDPEHIFRVLNVFAVHIKFIDDENKFGFDKVILVYDLENVRNAFNNKFGDNVDFNGYIDKFYSYDIFEFDNLDIVINKLNLLLSNLIVIKENSFEKKFVEIEQEYVIMSLFLKFILIDLLKTKNLNLRTILKLSSQKFEFLNKTVYFLENKKFPIKCSDFPLIVVIEFIKEIVGGLNNLQKLFSKLSEIAIPQAEQNNRKNLLIGSSIIILHEDRLKSIDDNNDVLTYEFENMEVMVDYKLYSKYVGMQEQVYGEAIQIYRQNGDDKINISLNHYKILSLVLRKLIKIGAITY
ncbi:MAG: KAP family NTPase [Bacteroidales bacterium]|nr:KAP family NTPase [Bacteroidales bacterium]